MAGFATPTVPNLPDFWDFLNTSVQIPTAALPTDSPWPGYAFNQALATVLTVPAWGCWPPGTNPPSNPLGILYTLAVYNLATHLLFMITPDQSGQTYFTNARSSTGYNLISPSMGLVTTTFDQGTGATVASPKWAAGMTIAQLEMYRTPWGRAYLSFAQSYGPSIVGLT
jgi:hypothetical protein